MKKIICTVLSLIMMLSVMVTASAQEENDFKYNIGDSDISIPSSKNEADILYKLGLFRGTGKGYELKKTVTRAEAITMVLRMIGEERDATTFNPEQRFSDVPPTYWAYANIGYAADKGYIDGTSETTFEPARTVTGQEFVKMLLTAMGYPEIYLDSAYEAGVKFALLVNNYTKLAVSTKGYSLLRNDVVNICYSALLTKTSDGKMLKDVLIEKGLADKDYLHSLILSESSDTPRSFAWNLNDFMPTDKNYMFSPLSIKMALAMAANGANGETKDEILKALEIEDLDKFNELSAQLIKDYGENEKVKLNIANSLWLNTDYYKNVEFEKSFENIIMDYYNADSGKVNHSNAVDIINNWVNKKTNGKITKLISDSDFLAYLVNAIYFKGEWAVQFDENATDKAEFTDRKGQKTEIDFMNMTSYFDYYEDDHTQMLKLPYKDGKTSMYIALSDGKASDVDKNIEKMERRRVQVSIPKFKTEFSVKLVDALSEMGIRTAFDEDRADFKSMCTAIPENIFISDVIHKTFISVDENGTEAAAVTGVSFEETSVPVDPPVIFNANRPFTYFIRDDINEEILFMGEYAYAE